MKRLEALDADAIPPEAPPAASYDPDHEAALRYEASMPWVDAASVEMHLALVRAYRVLNAVATRQIESLHLGAGLTSARCTVLRILYFAEGSRLAPIEISREMGVGPTNMTGLLDGLERHGLVIRIDSSADRRVCFAELTPAGHDLCSAMLPPMTRFIQKTCASFSLPDKRTLKDLLLRFQQDVAGYYPDGLVVDTSFAEQ